MVRHLLNVVVLVTGFLTTSYLLSTTRPSWSLAVWRFLLDNLSPTVLSRYGRFTDCRHVSLRVVAKRGEGGQVSGATTLSKLLGLPFSRIKLERYAQFGTVCYPHQTPPPKAM